MARKGLPKWAIKEAKRRGAKNIFAYAWTLVKRKKRPSKSRTTKSKTKTKKRRKPRMGKRKKRRGGKSLQRTVFKWLRVGALVAPAVNDFLRGATPQQKAVFIIESYSGYNIDKGEFDARWLARGWMPFLLTSLATYGIPKLMGIIRRL